MPPPLWENITVGFEPLCIDDVVSEEEEIEWAVKRLPSNCSIIPSIMRLEHLNQWLVEARDKKRLDNIH